MRHMMRLTAVVGWVAVAGLAGAAEPQFRKTQLNPKFTSEGVAVGDVNRDGKNDVLAGPLWYEAPNWVRHEISPVKEFHIVPRDGGNGYCESFENFADDVNGDGWVDFIVVGFPGQPAHWYENPKGSGGHWKRHEIFRSACNESPQYADVNGDGRKDLLMGFEPERQMAYFTPGDDPTKPWRQYNISETGAPGTVKFAHGLGVGDINRDGLMDVIVKEGWWQGQKDTSAGPWKFHAANLGTECADMHAYDVDGDGDQDVLSSSAHRYGVWWYENQPAANGQIEWTQHVIYNGVSQSHSLVLTDINGDGLKDLVTGKRYYAHNGKGDPGEEEPAELFWFELRRRSNGPSWVPHEIDNNAGVGTQFVMQDLDGDGREDIITSNKKGTHIFVRVDGR